MHLPDGSTLTLPPTTLHRVTLRFTAPARFRFLHGGALHGLLCRALGAHLPPGWVPCVAESGRVRFVAGERYRFGLSLIGGVSSGTSDDATDDDAIARRVDLDSLDGTFAEALDAIGRSSARRSRGRPATFDGNFRVDALERLEPPSTDELATRARALAAREVVELRWLSPLRLARRRDDRRRGRGHFDDEYFPAALFLQRLWQRWHLLRHGAYPRAHDIPEPPPGVRADARELLWIDLPVPGRDGKPGRPRGMTLGGVVGSLRLDGLTPDWCLLLAAMAGYHVGQSIGYGCGRYHLADLPHADEALDRPARSLLDHVADPAALERAHAHVAARSDSPGVDHLAPAQVTATDLEQLAAALRQGTYDAQPLRGVLIPKDDTDPAGPQRALAIPTAHDRIAQRAATEALGPSIEALFADCSFAYRKGLSRHAAARAIQRAYDDGFRVVLDADIAAFFDTVDHQRLLARLRALFPHEPLLQVVRQWLRAPVVFRGHTIERHRGLPQGAPIAPLLANLFLDAFDDEILGQDFRLVRYADDFVILCRDLDSAERARGAARQALADLGLELHDEKTGVRTFEQGFSYLGFLFCRSMVLEELREPGDALDTEAPRTPAAATGWLSALPLRALRRLEAPGRQRIRMTPLDDETSRRGRGKRPLYLSAQSNGPDDEPVRVRVDGEALRLERTEATDGNGSSIDRVPLRSLLHVVCTGRPRHQPRLGSRALQALARNDVPVYLCNESGRIEARITPFAPNWRVWQAQAQLQGESSLRLEYSRAVIAAKLRNAAVLAVRFRWPERESVAARLRSLADDAAATVSRESLRGFEGRAARLYFESLAEALPPPWRFPGRRRRPPTDSVNSMLSFGYTLLHHHATTALVEAGLNPALGLLHEPAGRHAALASDLQEELRYLVDALVWALISQRRVAQDDFERRSNGAVWLRPAARRRFVQEFERRILTEFTPPGATEPVTYREFLYRQAVQIRHLVVGRIDTYVPLRIQR